MKNVMNYKKEAKLHFYHGPEQIWGAKNEGFYYHMIHLASKQNSWEKKRNIQKARDSDSSLSWGNMSSKIILPFCGYFHFIMSSHPLCPIKILLVPSISETVSY